ncbi:hypothetical protein [Fischerella thermalis]|uniref:hypothetical protein n=1 Tax=Fischerella thermalis TaxID=372787 RepID=UPI00241E978E|nr:hypothetical protein [Fischerella thermalis]
MKAVLIATIGTRDLMFQISSGTWYNIGDDRMQNGEIIGEQAEVISDLRLHNITFRDLTKYLLDKITIYQERIKPVIIGKLLSEKAADIETVYLIATDQKLKVRERQKDTLYAAELIKAWIVNQFTHINVEIITLGQDGTNPSNFEQMFYWWRRTWREKITIQVDQPIWLCLKGGVGQASEASRISGLSFYGDRIQFFEFQQNTPANQAGIPSDYSGSFLGNNYLWDRTQQQALKLLARYDYAGAYDLLQPYFKKSSPSFETIANLLKAGIEWNQGKFDRFISLARSSSVAIPKLQDKLWMAYEQAYLSVVRLEQQNTIEAMLHSHRSVEGILYLWAEKLFPNDVIEKENQYPSLKNSILQKYPTLNRHFIDKQGMVLSEISFNGWVVQDLLNAAIPATINSIDFKAFWDSARKKRNYFSHRLGGLEEKEVFRAWGEDVTKSNGRNEYLIA